MVKSLKNTSKQLFLLSGFSFRFAAKLNNNIYKVMGFLKTKVSCVQQSSESIWNFRLRKIY